MTATFSATTTTLCPSCHCGPCHDGTLCDDSNRQRSTIVIYNATHYYDPPVSLRDVKAPHEPWRQQQPRSPRPRFRKGGRS